jgi:mannosyltransferase OCH1-like enzyme
MKKIFFSIFLALSCMVVLHTSVAKIIEVDFDTSMGIEEQGRYNLMSRDGKKSKKILDAFRDLYNTNLPSKIVASKSTKIPKIIHRIWIGPRPFPEQYKKCLDSCKRLHPDWKFILWTNKDIDKVLDINPKYKWLFNEYKYKKTVYQAQKDILEYLILYKYGGIYLDADIKCFKNMNEIVHSYKFFAGIEPPSRWTNSPVLSNRVVGSSPRNKIIADTLNISNSSYKNIYKEKNNSFLKRIARRIFKGKYIKIPDAKKALMVSLTKSVVKNRTQQEVIVFPATYFDAIFPNTKRYDVLDEIKVRLGIYKNKNKLFNNLKPETISISTDFVPSEDLLVMEKNGG